MSIAVVKVTPFPVIKALIFETEPVCVREDAVPPTVTPPPLVAVRLLDDTDSVTVTGLVTAFTSEKLIPVKAFTVHLYVN